MNRPALVAPSRPAATAAALQPLPTLMATSTRLPSPTPPTPTATPACAESGRIERGEFASIVAGGPVAYQVYLPPCYGQDGRLFPALYLFHGNIHDERTWDQLGVDEAAEAGIQAGTVPPLVIVMPDGGRTANMTSGGPGSFETLVLQELIPFAEATYCLWPEPAGRAVGGLSRGGYWALEIAFRHAELFGAVGGHSAALLDTVAGPDLNPQYTGLSRDLGDLRIYLDVGAEDYVRTNVERLHEDMAAASVPHTWQINPGGHDEAYWSAHVADYLAWYGAPWPHRRQDYPPCA